MRLFILKFTVIFTFFSSQCTLKNDANYINTNSLYNSSQLANNIEKNDLRNLDKIVLSKDITNVENSIKKTSKDFNLQNLKEKTLSNNEVEMRIWGEGVESSSVNVFILHKKNEEWSALLVSVRVGDDGEYEKTKQNKININKQIFSVPKSGWKNLSDYLSQKDIRIPLPYSLDTQESLPIPDERTIDLEIKEGKNYNLVFYREFTKTKDGQTAINICNYLEMEFNIVIGCGR